MNIHIVGAGMAGLLAGNMLRQFEPVIYEKQNELPNNHSAVLRFRSSVVGDVLGVPFQKVTMVKSAIPWRNPIADAIAYTNKCTGFLRSDRSMPTAPVTEERYIAPADLIQRMAMKLTFKFGQDISAASLKLNGGLKSSTAIISTMPMPILMKLLEYECPSNVSFTSTPGANLRATIFKCDAYVSVYIPDPNYIFSRLSISGNQLIIEIPSAHLHEVDKVDQLMLACYLLGIERDRIMDDTVMVSEQKYSKILPIDDDARKDFIFWATDKYNIYSLGRFATWRPKLLLDDLVNDVRKIADWSARNNRYEAAKSR